MMVTMRLNVYDGHPYPWGWGVSQEDPGVPDLEEPIRFVRGLYERGVRLLNVTAGNPYYTPHINRPYDTPVPGRPRDPAWISTFSYARKRFTLGEQSPAAILIWVNDQGANLTH